MGRAEASAGAARSLLGAFVSGAGPGSPDSQAFSAAEEEEIRFSTGGDIHSAFEKLALGGDDGDGGDGVSLFVLTDLEACCLGRVGTGSPVHAGQGAVLWIGRIGLGSGGAGRIRPVRERSVPAAAFVPGHRSPPTRRGRSNYAGDGCVAFGEGGSEGRGGGGG